MKRYASASEIHVGVIGYGGAFNMGKFHLDMMRKAGMTPVAVADVDPRRLAVAQRDFPHIETYPGVDAMLKDSDVSLVVVITPHNTHAGLAVQCLRGGRHVVCEKPLAITTAECDRILETARKQGLMVSTFHNRHWDGCILQAMKTIRRGAIGDVVRIRCRMNSYGKPDDWWRTSRTLSGGILYDWGVHLLEYSLQILEGDLTEVSGFSREGTWAPHTRWKEDTNEDDAFAVVRFSSGQWLTLAMSVIDAEGPGHWVVITGTRGVYKFDYASYEYIQPRNGRVVRTSGPNPKDEGWRYYANVVDHLVAGTPLVITPAWSRRPIHILDLAARSARQGRSLRAKYP